VRLDGHAIEARVCAEDPERGFLPSAGRLALLEWPQGEGVRVDAGFGSGDVVPDCYDSLLGKVIAWAPDREQAAAKLAAALERTYCAGVRSNEHWLARMLRSRRFLEVRHNITLLDQGAGEPAAAAALPREALVLAALAMQCAAAEPPPSRRATPWEAVDGFIPNLPALVGYRLGWRGHSHLVQLECVAGAVVAASVDEGERANLTGAALRDGHIAARLEGRRRQARCHRHGARLWLWYAAELYEFELDDPRTHEFSASAASGGLTTPLPGVVVAVAVARGQQVAAGEVLMVIEAMKMEHTITAPYAGTVTSIHFLHGERVPEGSELLELARAD
jgi:3-methylcrotonyl-CoA carboxylase alpha subunit